MVSPPIVTKWRKRGTCLRLRVAKKDPSWRFALVTDTSLPPKPNVAAAGLFSHTGARASGGAAPNSAAKQISALHLKLQSCNQDSASDWTLMVSSKQAWPTQPEMHYNDDFST